MVQGGEGGTLDLCPRKNTRALRFRAQFTNYLLRNNGCFDQIHKYRRRKTFTGTAFVGGLFHYILFIWPCRVWMRSNMGNLHTNGSRLRRSLSRHFLNGLRIVCDVHYIHPVYGAVGCCSSSSSTLSSVHTVHRNTVAGYPRTRVVLRY